MPAALSGDPPRRAKVKLEVIALPIVILFLIWLAPILIAPIILNIYHEEKVLRERGIETDGTIISKKLVKSRNTESYEIWYEYEIFEKGVFKKIKRKGSIGVNDKITSSDANTIPIVYDPNNSCTSRINEDYRFREDRNIDREGDLLMYLFIAIILPILLSFWIVFPAYRKSRREKRILSIGRAAPATLVEMKHSSFRGIALVRLTFCFVDEAGVTVHGRYGPYAAGRSEDPTAASAWERYLSTLTVVYDPKDSRKNLLYPAHYAELR